MVSSCDVSNLSTFLLEPDCFFYRYEYHPSQRSRNAPIFTLLGGVPIRVPPHADDPVARRDGKPHCKDGARGTISLSRSHSQNASALGTHSAAPQRSGDFAGQHKGGEHCSAPSRSARQASAELGGILSSTDGEREADADAIDPKPRRRSREEKLVALQVKLDSIFPPFTCSLSGEWTNEFVGVIPGEGEKYAGEGCARCNVRGCDRFGLIFHLKNLMTHGSPRGGQPSKVPASKTHSAALRALLGYTPEPPPLPKEGEATEKKAQKAKQDVRRTHEDAMVEVDVPTGVGPSETGGESGSIDPLLARRLEVLADAAGERQVRQPAMAVLPRDRHGHQESRNFSGHDGRFIHYRGMKLPFHCGQVLLLRRKLLSDNPARNVKFLGNLSGTPTDWKGPLEVAQERAAHANLVLLLAFRYDDLHLSQSGGLDSNHCLHLFNHFRPEGKKMINKWETYMPVALHRTYERLIRQPLRISPVELEQLQLDSVFGALREKEIVKMKQIQEEVDPASSLGEAKHRILLLVTRKWTSSVSLGVG